jgi:predicted pyridoxine 5'-phosphate oxidase superfamily flavin-nucleotide-binding protein
MTSDNNPWLSYHEGELAVQRRAGVRHGPGTMYHPAMPAGVRQFLAQQQLAILASVDRDGSLWASLRSGAPGFITAVDEQTLRIGGYSHPEDLVMENPAAHDQLGLLVIDLETRSRLRVNGTAIVESDGAIVLKTKQVYGNCQKYIQARMIVGERKAVAAGARSSERLDARQQSWITAADTFFIATAHRRGGADGSHRGGQPSFVRVETASRLVFPDYRGNGMFNTLGNLESNPRTGLLFPDFAAGAVLQLSGRAAVLWDDPRLAEFPGAERLVVFDIEKVVELSEATHLRFQFAGYSPALPR